MTAKFSVYVQWLCKFHLLCKSLCSFISFKRSHCSERLLLAMCDNECLLHFKSD